MSNASIFIGRTQPPTFEGHGTAIAATQAHAESKGGTHYVFPTHTTGTEDDPLDHETKVAAMRKLFPTANIVSDPDIRTPVQMMQYLEKQGHTHVTILGGGEEDQNKWKFLDKYKEKEFPGIKSVKTASAGERDPNAKGAVGMSGTKLRKLVKAGKRDEFIAQYPDEHKETANMLYDRLTSAFAAIKNKKKKKKLKESATAFFLIGGPGSGKDFVLKNTFAKYDLMEVQIDQVLNGAANKLFEQNKNLVINGPVDADKINEVIAIHENYNFDYIYVSVTNKVSRVRNEQREVPLNESKRIQKFLTVEKLVESLQDVFIFNNSMDINAPSAFEKIIFEDQTVKLEQRIQENGIMPVAIPQLQSFIFLREKKFAKVAKDKESGLPKKYVAGLSKDTAKARAAHWKEKAKLSDSDPRAYEPAPGDATAETKPSKHTLAIRKAMGEGIDFNAPIPPRIDPRKNRAPRSGNITAVMQKRNIIKRMQTIKETYNLKDLIDTTKSISNQLSIPANKLNIMSESKAAYSDNNVIWEAVKHPSSQRWYLTGKYNENNNE